MLIRASIRSSKSTKTATAAVDYVLSDFDAKKQKRAVKPQILYGDPDLIKSYDKHKNASKKNASTSGVIALRDNEKLNTAEKKQELINSFINLVIPEKYRDKVDLLIVEHQDKGSQEFHFIIPHLTSEGERFNPFPVVGRDRGKNSFEATKAMTRLLNEQFNFAQVYDNDKKKGLSNSEFKHAKYINIKTKAGKDLLKKEKEEFTKRLKTVIKENDIKDREGLVNILKEGGQYKDIKTYDNRTTFILNNGRKLTMYAGIFAGQSENYYSKMKASLVDLVDLIDAQKDYTQADKAKDLETIKEWHKVLETQFDTSLTAKEQNKQACKKVKGFQKAAGINLKPEPQPQQQQQQVIAVSNAETLGGTASSVDVGSAEAGVSIAMSELKQAEAKYGPNSIQAKQARQKLQQAQKALEQAKEAQAKEQDQQRKRKGMKM